ncbi:DUF3558 domain-containing protein [Nocardia wallacei]|uniref:DUF3558 domain-containing protein n=1 Tax=Nocardia wallacei TaxID=480035 RepID=UPI0024554344|nr:DUF3558 domain-containing protein [Nocardia wallacei]
MTRRLAVVLLATLVPVLAACDGGGGGGSTGSETTTAEVALWDPCTQVPDDVLQRAGVDPKTKESGIAGVHQSGWEICNWKGKQYTVGVFSGKRSVQEIESKEGNTDFRDVVLAGRQGRQFRVEGASKDLTCDVVFPAGQGVFELTVMSNPILDNPGDPCLFLRQAGEQLVPVLPK